MASFSDTISSHFERSPAREMSVKAGLVGTVRIHRAAIGHSRPEVQQHPEAKPDEPASTMSSMSSASKKRVRWSTITIHEFGVGHGGSAVPKSGPSIGLARRPEFTWSTRVGTMARECDGVRRFSSTERVALLRAAGYSSERIEAFEDEAADVRDSRELYYSAEMRAFRKKRKKAKAQTRAARRQSHSECKGSITMHAKTKAHESLPSASKRLRIQVAVSTAAVEPEQGRAGDKHSAALVPPMPLPMPLSPCCS